MHGGTETFSTWSSHSSADIIDAFKESLKHLEWMDEKSGKAAAEKVGCFLHLVQITAKLNVV